MSDQVNHPSHYTAGPIEVIDIIEGFNLGFHLGNVVKYILRSPFKGAALQDLKKARWYLDRLISNLEKEASKANGSHRRSKKQPPRRQARVRRRRQSSHSR